MCAGPSAQGSRERVEVTETTEDGMHRVLRRHNIWVRYTAARVRRCMRCTGPAHRDAGTRQIGEPGTLQKLDELAWSFMRVEGDGRAKLLAEAEAYRKSLTNAVDIANAEVYMKIFKAVQDKGSDYAKAEMARLEKLLGSGAVPDAKKKDIGRRRNILRAFVVGTV